MDMEEGDTIEVFTQQSGGDGTREESNNNANHLHLLNFEQMKCDISSNSNIILYIQPFPSGLPFSKCKWREIKKAL